MIALIVMDFRQEFIEFSLSRNVLRFGEFKTKAGRLSPYFFNAGLFNDGKALDNLSQFYAKAILSSKLPFDMLYGPAYKGIPLVTAISMALSRSGHNFSFAFNRKEIKDTETDTFKARSYSTQEIANRAYDLDLCGYPTAEEEVFSPEETIRVFHEKRDSLNAKIDKRLAQIEELLGLKK